MQRYAQVVPLQAIRQVFTYSVPDDLAAAAVGVRAIIPFGRKLVTGVIVGFTDETPTQKLKPLWDVLDASPIWTKEYLDFTSWIAEYYFAPWGEVLRAALPQGMAAESDFRVVPIAKDLTDSATLFPEKRETKRELLLRLVAQNPAGIGMKALRKKMGTSALAAIIKECEAQGLVAVHATDVALRAKPKLVRFLRLSESLLYNADNLREAFDELEKHSPRQAAVAALLLEHYHKEKTGLPVAAITAKTGASSAALHRLVEKEYAVEYTIETIRSSFSQFADETPTPPNVVLNTAQRDAVTTLQSAVAEGTYTAFLLHGVTGSGKTQVYIEVIKTVLAQGRAVITLVPEISLTPQLIGRYRAHFGEQVAVLHSKMGIGERYDAWRGVQSGKHNVIIGVRSAVFAPVKNLGLIVADEEHESSFKQSDPPRYNARDCAVVRAQMQHAVAVLGSATPSLESYYNAATGKYRLLELPERADGALMPEVMAVNMRDARKKHEVRDSISFTLRDHIALRLKKREGIILLQNRRGFAPVQQCMDCGASPQCPHCSVTLTFHKVNNLLRCHYCGFTIPAVKACATCGSTDVKLFGAGTQRVEEDVVALFPDAKIVRMDMDTTSRKGSHKTILDSFGSGESDILLGTQMVAKGLDFPRVTLVGVINADTQMHLPDFRAGERTFQLLTQVAGRAGRTLAQLGEVIIQTSNPDEEAIKCALQHDFKSFYALELQKRRELMYPPYSRIIMVELKGKDEKIVQEHAGMLAKRIEPRKGSEILGPQQAPIQKLRDEYRWRILIKNNKDADPSGAIIRASVQRALDEYAAHHATRAVRVIVDVDPQGV